MRLRSRVLRKVAPRTYWTRRFRYLQSAEHEPELVLLPLLSHPSSISVDVGAAGGAFAARLVPVSKQVIAFEPRPSGANDLREMSRTLGLPIQVEQAALSDSSGDVLLRMIEEDPGRSTIEGANSLQDDDGGNVSDVRVKKVCLDDFGLDHVGFIKIDTEGHEMAVLEGARRTLSTSRPNLMIEAEERHNPGAVQRLGRFLDDLGYAGFFLLDGALESFDAFDESVHQRSENIGGWRSGWERRGVYIDNFIFVPRTEAAEFLDTGNALLRSAEAMDA